MWVEGEVTKADDFGYPQKRMSNETKAGIGGAVVGGLGAHQLLGSRNVAARTASGLRHAEQQHMTNSRLLTEANTAVAAGTGKGKRAKARVQRATEARAAHDTTAHKLAWARKMSSPEQVARRVGHMRKVGGGLLAGGAAIAAAPWALKSLKKPAPTEPVTKQSRVSKTISQARYGANAELGRKWRTEDSREKKAPLAALGAAGVGTAGAGTAGFAQHRLRNPRVENFEPVLRKKEGELAARISEAEAHVANAKAKHQATKPHRAVLEEAQGKHAKIPGLINANAAERAAERGKVLRLRRVGLGAAAVGGVGALAAGIKAERDKNPNLKKPVRKSLLDIRQSKPLGMKSYATKKKIGKLKGIGDYKQHAKAEGA